MGGIKINENMEALNGNGAAVLGLYAGGYDAGGMFGDSYPIQGSSGLSSAFAINSVRIAGRNALRYIGR
jgi:fumarate reductase flavoprotein subunit